MHGSLAYTPDDFATAVDHAATRQNVLARMITSTIALDDIVVQGFEKLSARGHDEVKVMVPPC